MRLAVSRGFRQCQGQRLYVHWEVGGSAGTQFHPLIERSGQHTSKRVGVHAPARLLCTGGLGVGGGGRRLEVDGYGSRFLRISLARRPFSASMEVREEASCWSDPCEYNR